MEKVKINDSYLYWLLPVSVSRDVYTPFLLQVCKWHKFDPY